MLHHRSDHESLCLCRDWLSSNEPPTALLQARRTIFREDRLHPCCFHLATLLAPSHTSVLLYSSRPSLRRHADSLLPFQPECAEQLLEAVWRDTADTPRLRAWFRRQGLAAPCPGHLLDTSW